MGAIAVLVLREKKKLDLQRKRGRESKRMEGTDRIGLYDNGLYRATVGPKLSCKVLGL